MTIFKVLAAAALLGASATGFAETPVRFEPAVMTPATKVQYVDVARNSIAIIAAIIASRWPTITGMRR